ncbi:MAG: bifunctional nuclease family protein [Bacteroidaceae bacterium]|nr:bifunctional nuclease family protein [Bacteroidaceae bacterium]
MILIRFKHTQEIKQAKFINLLILVDQDEKRQLVVVTDKPTAMNISATHEARKDPWARRLFLQRSALHVVMSLMPEEMKKLMFIHIDRIIDGQYQAHLVRRNAELNEPEHPLRISEAILLSLVADIPIYIDDHLWRIQSTPYNETSNGTTIPANTLPLPLLKSALKSAIENEQYEMAKILNDEINNRFPQE